MTKNKVQFWKSNNSFHMNGNKYLRSREQLLFLKTASTCHQIELDKYLQCVTVIENWAYILRAPKKETATSKTFACITSWLKL